eukprot:m.275707 g.275707  ORF g.275707 m.275707 type:complete len:275 (-) comp26905_c3_seq1:740-1564(-)
MMGNSQSTREPAVGADSGDGDAASTRFTTPPPDDPSAVSLGSLPAGSSVAVMLLAGSLNPVTLGHVQMLTQGRTLLLDPAVCGERFDAVVALVFANSDEWVNRKLAPDRLHLSFTRATRRRLLAVSSSALPWVLFNADGSEFDLCQLVDRHPDLAFTQYMLNGADDVVKYEKWRYVSAHEDGRRYITSGRPGHTHLVRGGIDDRIATELALSGDAATAAHHRFLIGSDLPDVSSSAAREAAVNRDRDALLEMVHPAVADALLEKAHTGDLGAVA